MPVVSFCASASSLTNKFCGERTEFYSAFHEEISKQMVAEWSVK